MTQIEFTERTQMFVTAEMFNELHKQYMASPLDKDAWCKQYKRKHELDATKEMVDKIAELEQALKVQQERAERAAAAAQKELINSLNKQNAYAEELVRIYDIKGDYKAINQLFCKLNDRYLESHPYMKPQQ